MKLVDILARELKAWPFGGHFAWQDYDKEVRFSPDSKHVFHMSELAEDNVRPRHGLNPLSGVTRAEWQAAVDALNAPKVVEWDGAGLPPVGSVVDTDHKNKELRVKILAYSSHHGGASCVMAADMSHGREGKLFGWMSDQCNFRPVRTAEQVAAEEREKAIKEMTQHGVDAGDSTIEYSCAALYDAGYRKEPKPCGS